MADTSMLMPAIILNSSPAMWLATPMSKRFDAGPTAGMDCADQSPVPQPCFHDRAKHRPRVPSLRLSVSAARSQQFCLVACLLRTSIRIEESDNAEPSFHDMVAAARGASSASFARTTQTNQSCWARCSGCRCHHSACVRSVGDCRGRPCVNSRHGRILYLRNQCMFVRPVASHPKRRGQTDPLEHNPTSELRSLAPRCYVEGFGCCALVVWRRTWLPCVARGICLGASHARCNKARRATHSRATERERSVGRSREGKSRLAHGNYARRSKDLGAVSRTQPSVSPELIAPHRCIATGQAVAAVGCRRHS